MKNLSTYISESILGNEEFGMLFESNGRNLTLQEVFEKIGDAMIADAMVQEGLFSKIGAKLAAWGKKAAEKGEAADEKISKLSNDVKTAVDNAIETTKQKAGDTWDDMKDAYKSVVSSVGAGVDSAKRAIADVAKLTGQKMEDVVSTVSAVCSNGLAKGKEAIGKALETPAKMAAIALLVAAAQSCQKNGISILDILVSAGIDA